MVFNSIVFAVFLPLVFFLYWFVFRRSLRRQNLLLIAASYVFYGWWDWRFLGLLVLSSTLDFFIGIGIDGSDSARRKKLLLVGTLLLNFGLLGFFKYFNFFVDSFVSAFGAMGVTLHPTTLKIVLPVGISFYTFQELSYTIDVYRGRLKAIRDPFAFYAFVSFFPQLVAGPIERAAHMLPQFQRPRTFDRAQAVGGLQLILWGLFKKVVIADRLAQFVDAVYMSPGSYGGLSTAVAILFFTIQIYCDFSGYSDIARGSARLLGFELMENFKTPFFASSLRDYWHRWHVSLSSWFRDYLYYPLGGSRNGTARTLLNIMIVFLVSGLWHGARWTFVLWGALHGTGLCIENLLGGKRRLPKVLATIFTFVFACYAFSWFRATGFANAADLHLALGNSWSFRELQKSFEATYSGGMYFVTQLILLLAVFFFVETLLSKKQPEQWLAGMRRPLRWGVYYAFVFAILIWGVFINAPTFIYFQF